MMMYAKLHFTANEQTAINQHIQCVIDHTFDRILDGYHTIMTGARFHFPEHLINTAKCLGLDGMSEMFYSCSLGKGTCGSQIGNA